MNTQLPSVPLRDLLSRTIEEVHILADHTYRLLTVGWWGKGVVERKTVNGSEIASANLYRVRPNDFIISRIDARKGACDVVAPEFEGAVVTNDFPVYRLNSDRLLPPFLKWLSKTAWFIDLCNQASEGTTNRVRLQEDRFLARTIPVPPLPEQRRIVTRIEELADKIAEARRLATHSQAEATALDGSVDEGLVTSALKTARTMRLEEVITSHDSGWSPQCEDRNARPNEWGVLKTTSVQWDGFAPAENKALQVAYSPRPELQVASGDVLITRAGPINRVGVACCVTVEAPNLMLSDKIVRIRLKPDVNPEYLVMALRSKTVQDHFRHGKTGLADSQVNISREKLLAVKVPIPEVSLQEQLVEKRRKSSGRLATVLSVQRSVRAELDALLPSVLDKAFRGEL